MNNGPDVPVHHQHDGPTGRSRPVRRHDFQDRRRRPSGAPARRGPNRTGAQGYDQTCRLDGQPSVALSIYQLPGSNALGNRQARARQNGRSEKPVSRTGSITPSSTTRRRSSTNRSTKCSRPCATQSFWWPSWCWCFCRTGGRPSFRSIAVPVAIVGTFAVMAAMGFSLNNLTLFGLVLAIGIVVDDAIVVVEAVEHHIEHGLSPREATIEGHGASLGPGDRGRPGAQRRVRSLRVHQRHHGAVLSAVCVDDFGVDGDFGVQFADAEPRTDGAVVAAAQQGHCPAAAVAGVCDCRRLAGLASFCRLVARRESICRVNLDFLRPTCRGLPPVSAPSPAASSAWPLNQMLGFAFRAFNSAFDFTAGFTRGRSAGCCECQLIVLCALRRTVVPDLLRLCANTQGIYSHARQRLSGRQFAIARLGFGGPHRTSDAADRKHRAAQRRASSTRWRISGQSILLNANAPNFGAMYVMLDDFHDRLAPGLIGRRHRRHAASASLQDEIAEGVVNVLGAPPLEGLGTAGGFKIMIEDRGNSGLEIAANGGRRHRGRRPKQHRELRDLFTSFRANTPWLYLDIDRTAAKMMGVSMAEVFNTLQVYLGSLYVNDFNLFGRTWQVNVQAEQNFREQIDDLKQLKIRSERAADGAVWLVCLRAQTSPGRCSSTATTCIPRRRSIAARSVDQLGPGDRVDAKTWSTTISPGRCATNGPSWRCCNCKPATRPCWCSLLAVVLVFLVLAAQYESWSLPLAVILVVPMCLLCSIAAVLLAPVGCQHLHAGRLRRADRAWRARTRFWLSSSPGPGARPAKPLTKRRWKLAACDCGRS